MPDIPKSTSKFEPSLVNEQGQRLLPPAKEISTSQIKNKNGKNITSFQSEVVQSLAVQNLTNSQVQNLLNPANELPSNLSSNLPSTSGIATFNQNINQTVAQITQNQTLNQSKNSTLLQGAIVQVPKIPNGEIPNPESLTVPTGENVSEIAGQNASVEIAKLTQELAGQLSKSPEQIQQTKKEGVGILKGMKNWAKESKMIAGLEKGVKDGIKFYKENPEQLAKLVISGVGIVIAGVVISPVIVANLVPGGTLAIAGKTIAGIGTYGLVGLQTTGVAAPGLSVFSAAGAVGISSKFGDMVAGGIKGVRNFFDNNRNDNRNKINQQSEMPPIQSNYDNNSNRAILSSNLQNEQNYSVSETQNTQSPQNIQNQNSTTENPALQIPQIEQNQQIPNSNEQILEIKSLEESLKLTKQPEFEKERKELLEKTTKSMKKTFDFGNSKDLGSSQIFNALLGTKDMAIDDISKTDLNGLTIAKVQETADKLKQKFPIPEFPSENLTDEEKFGQRAEIKKIKIKREIINQYAEAILKLAKNQQIIDQTTKLGENALDSEKSSNAVMLNPQNIKEEIGGGSQNAKKLRENGFKTFRENGKYILKYEPEITTSQEINQKSNLINLDVEKPIEIQTEQIEPVLEFLPAIPRQLPKDSEQIETQEALPDPNLEIQQESLNKVMESGFGTKALLIREAQNNFVKELQEMLKYDGTNTFGREALQDRIKSFIKDLFGQDNPMKKLVNLFSGKNKYSSISLFPEEKFKFFVRQIKEIKTSDRELQERINKFLAKESLQTLVKEADSVELDINQSIKLLEDEFNGLNNQNELVFGKIENGTRKIMFGTGEMKIKLENLKKAGFEIYKTNTGLKVEFVPQKAESISSYFEALKSKDLPNSQKSSSSIELTKDELEFTNPKMKEKAENN